MAQTRNLFANGNIFVPKTAEQFTYDLDGNLTSDGRWNYTWDAENRLIKMESRNDAPAASVRRLTFQYDWMGRRVRKAVELGTNSTWTMVLSNKFVYDGWNLIAELNATNNALINSYMWGLDVSGTMGGAGGVGGLILGTQPGNRTLFAAMDGNGNVGGLILASDGTTGARYEYGPFGEVVRSSGDRGKVNPFRFSTKYQDEESDLLYYGYRYYLASSGKWISRDPIAERGGLNVSGFLGNSPIQTTDRLGAEPALPPGWQGPGKPYNPRFNPSAPIPSTPDEQLFLAVATHYVGGTGGTLKLYGRPWSDSLMAQPTVKDSIDAALDAAAAESYNRFLATGKAWGSFSKTDDNVFVNSTMGLRATINQGHLVTSGKWRIPDCGLIELYDINNLFLDEIAWKTKPLFGYGGAPQGWDEHYSDWAGAYFGYVFGFAGGYREFHLEIGWPSEDLSYRVERKRVIRISK